MTKTLCNENGATRVCIQMVQLTCYQVHDIQCRRRTCPCPYDIPAVGTFHTFHSKQAVNMIVDEILDLTAEAFL